MPVHSYQLEIRLSDWPIMQHDQTSLRSQFIRPMCLLDLLMLLKFVFSYLGALATSSVGNKRTKIV